MVMAYSVNDGIAEVTDAGNGRWVRLTKRTVKVSDRLEMDLITAGSVTDPECYVDAVDAFYKHCRDSRKAMRREWTFASESDAAAAYRILQRIIEM